MDEKLCKKCNQRPAKKQEKYCGKCRAAVLKEERAKSPEAQSEPVRTISTMGAEQFGRKQTAWQTLDMDHEEE